MRERKENSYELKEARKKAERKELKKGMKKKERREVRKKEKRMSKKKREINKEFARVTYVFVSLFLVLMAYIIYFNVELSEDIINSPYNPRLDSMADRVVRGKIVDNAGNTLAETQIAQDGSEYRYYPYGNLYAHVVGYSCRGKSGVESRANFELLTSHAFFGEKILNEFQDQKNMGDTITTTLDTNLQQAVYNALGSYRGAVVIIEPSTGKIRAMVSKPDFDPNTVNENWDYLNSDPNSYLLNRCTQGAYAPGSTFKLVTALEYMRENANYENYNYYCNSEITQDGTTIACAGHNAHGDVNLASSLAYSCNTSFSNIGLQLDLAQYKETTKQLLFDTKLPGGFSARKSSFMLTEGDGVADIMMTAMGQGKTSVSPYHMALITAAIANNGILMEPYVIDTISNYTGSLVKQTDPTPYKELMSPEEAAKLKSYMQDVVNYGTANVLSGQIYTVAGKTGTAEYSSDIEKNHSWFVGYTNVDSPELAICVLIESSDGQVRAVDVAKQIFDAYYY